MSKQFGKPNAWLRYSAAVLLALSIQSEIHRTACQADEVRAHQSYLVRIPSAAQSAISSTSEGVVVLAIEAAGAHGTDVVVQSTAAEPIYEATSGDWQLTETLDGSRWSVGNSGSLSLQMPASSTAEVVVTIIAN